MNGAAYFDVFFIWYRWSILLVCNIVCTLWLSSMFVAYRTR